VIYLKSALVGLVAVAAVLSAIMGVAFLVGELWLRTHSGALDFSIGLNLLPLSWVVPALVFGAAFYWGYRRLSRRGKVNS
jgi:hypothetical protein